MSEHSVSVSWFPHSFYSSFPLRVAFIIPLFVPLSGILSKSCAIIPAMILLFLGRPISERRRGLYGIPRRGRWAYNNSQFSSFWHLIALWKCHWLEISMAVRELILSGGWQAWISHDYSKQSLKRFQWMTVPSKWTPWWMTAGHVVSLQSWDCCLSVDIENRPSVSWSSLPSPMLLPFLLWNSRLVYSR